MIEYRSVKFFFDTLQANLWGLNLEEWVATSIGSGRRDDAWTWCIYLENVKSKEEKIVRIPCYMD